MRCHCPPSTISLDLINCEPAARNLPTNSFPIPTTTNFQAILRTFTVKSMVDLSTATLLKVSTDHGTLVDVGGDMVSVPTAAFDPIFW